MHTQYVAKLKQRCLHFVCVCAAVDRAELVMLQKEFGRVTSRAPDSVVSKDQFDVALTAVGLQDADKDILCRIFVLLDRGADYRINYRVRSSDE